MNETEQEKKAPAEERESHTYRNLFRLYWKYGRDGSIQKDSYTELLQKAQLNSVDECSVDGKPEELPKDLEEMGPTFIKLGQILSTRADLVPSTYRTALSRLQDQVEPFPFEQVSALVEEELGVRISKAFETFDPDPLAAGSLGQVHAATLRDGHPVVVKVQRPGIRKQIMEDLAALGDLASFLEKHSDRAQRYQLVQVMEEFKKSLMRELNFELEAQSLIRLAENMQGISQIEVPLPVDDYTSTRVLTMEHVSGTKVTDLGPLSRMELNTTTLVENLFRAYLQQVLVDGFFHADPHPGNVFLTDDGRIALIDLGMTAQVRPRLQAHLLQLLLALADCEADTAIDVALKVGDVRNSERVAEFKRRMVDLMERNHKATVKDLQCGTVIMEIIGAAADCEIRLPSELSLLAKMLLNIDMVAKHLDPNFDPNESIRRNAESLMRRKMVKNLAPSNIFDQLLETKDLVERLPRRLNSILDSLADQSFSVRVDAIDEIFLMKGIQKVANRITVGLVLAAMIIAGAMIMNIESGWELFGYPGLAILLFLGAIIGGVCLLVQILWNDK